MLRPVKWISVTGVESRIAEQHRKTSYVPRGIPAAWYQHRVHLFANGQRGSAVCWAPCLNMAHPVLSLIKTESLTHIHVDQACIRLFWSLFSVLAGIYIEIAALSLTAVRVFSSLQCWYTLELQKFVAYLSFVQFCKR